MTLWELKACVFGLEDKPKAPEAMTNEQLRSMGVDGY